MKVLYIGVYRDGSGWARSACDYLLALDEVGIDVVPRPVKLNNWYGKIPDRIVELEKNSTKCCDVVIQHLLPYHMDYCGSFRKNIGLFACETDNFSKAMWHRRLNLMDEAWVINHDMVFACKNSGVTIPRMVVPHACDTSKYERSYPKLDIPELRGKFVFYFIGENNRRKNLPALLRAFHTEFHPSEPVALVIKTSVPGLSPEECGKQTAEMCDVIKRQLKLRKQRVGYIPEVIITSEMSDEEIMSLHTTCNCYVGPSLGEAWNIGAFDALAMGNTPILTNCGGHRDFLTNDDGKLGGWLVNASKENVIGMDQSFDDLYLGTEKWWSISLSHLRKCMREAYESPRVREQKAEIGVARAYDFSYRKIGGLMAKLLEK